MTDEMMSLRALLEKTPDADLLREMIGFAAQRLMELEVEGLTGAGYREKSPDRLAQRNGEAVNHYAGTIEGDKIDMVLSIEDAASSHEPVSFMLSRIVD
jgi:putative transposase